MIRKIWILLTLMMCMLIIVGCKTTTKVTLESEPSGAEVIFEGKSIGNTPIHDYKIKNAIQRDYQIILKKDGYRIWQGKLKTEAKIANVIGGYISLVPLLWAQGPTEFQYFILIKE